MANASPLEPADKGREARRVTLVGAAFDGLLGLFKVMVGTLVGSAALVADGIHSFSDLGTDAFVLAATHFGHQAPDRNHPYGHGRIETLATLWLGSVLLFVAGGIAWASVMRLSTGEPIPTPGLWAILLAVVALAIKEWLYHYTLRTARRIGSKLLEANAWHSRSDALSTVVVLVGLVGAQFGHGWLDAVAAVLVALLVGKIGGRLLWESSQELIDTALPESQQAAMRQEGQGVPGVRGIHDLRTRTVGGNVLLDLHIVVPPRISVSEAHEIGNEVSRRLRQAFPDLHDVTFHIDPEDDQNMLAHSHQPGLPLRREVEARLAEAWGDEPCWQSRLALDLHYLDNRIDISLYIDASTAEVALEPLAASLRQRAAHLTWLGRLRLWVGPGETARR
ncbi:cation diffusion facilitator family transporter [Halomonas sp. NCCP-2165]|nr:cation diffusion facilitator family transporter [Halomonas sp. NCCP-2165]GKW49298.1 cation diffusion facilitator transporter [Halomonas sp. NCCP-2165]